MTKKFLDRKTGARNFEARNGRIVSRTQAKSRSKGKSVSAEKKKEIAITGRREKVYAEILAVSSMEVNVENSRVLSHCEFAEEQRWKKILERKTAQREQSFRVAPRSLQRIPQRKLHEPTV